MNLIPLADGEEFDAYGSLTEEEGGCGAEGCGLFNIKVCSSDNQITLGHILDLVKVAGRRRLVLSEALENVTTALCMHWGSVSWIREKGFQLRESRSIMS